MRSGIKPSPRILVVLLVAILAFTLSPRLAQNAHAAVYQPGVKVGDWWNYGSVETSCGVSPCQSPNPIGITFRVVSVSGSNVSLREREHYPNGTTVASTLSGDIASGAGNLTGGVSPMIAAGLGPGDLIFNDPSAPRINSTASVSFAGDDRQANILNITNPFVGTIYYDKLTGILLQLSLSSSTLSVQIVITGTNLWTYHISVPDDSSCNGNDLAFCGFVPLQALVVVGSNVEWDNIGSSTHQVESCNGQVTSAYCPFVTDPSLPTFQSPQILPGSSFTLKFNNTGIYYYYDPLHQGMKALIAVQGNATAPPDFSITAQPTSLTVKAGASNYTSISLAPTNGFLGLVTLTSSFSRGQNYPTFIGPQGDTANLGIVQSYGTELLVKTNLTTLNGIYTANVTGTYGPVSNSVSVTVSVTGGAPDFSITANPTTLILPPPGNSTWIHPPIVAITSLNGFQGLVKLVATVSPPGLIIELDSFSNNNASIALELSPNGQNATAVDPVPLPSTSPGLYSVTVKGTSGSIAHTANVTIILGAARPDFTISANPLSMVVPATGQASSIISMRSIDGFSGNLTMSAVSLIAVVPIPSNSTIVRVFPPGSLPTIIITPKQVFLPANGTATATLTLVGNADQPPITTYVNVTAASGTVYHSITVTAQLLSHPSDFSLFLTTPFPSQVIAGGSLSVGVSLVSVVSTGFNGTVTLSGTINPVAKNGPIVTITPNNIRLTPPGPFSATAQISTTASTPPGNYTLIITGTSGTLVHTNQLQISVLPPPVITVTPSSGTFGTKVTVNGSDFPSFSPGLFQSNAQVEVTFDNQFIGFTYVVNGQFTFTFNIPVSQSTQHEIHAVETYPIAVTATANFTVLPQPSSLSISLSSGSIYFPGDNAVVTISATVNGLPANPSSITVVVVRPDGSNTTLTTKQLTVGVFQASISIPGNGLIGTYAVIVRGHFPGASDSQALGSFEVKPSWLSSNGRNIAIAAGVAGTIGMLGFVGVAWSRGYFRRRDGFQPEQ